MTDQIFVSYSKKDSEFAYKLVEDLEAAGFKVWIDRSITGGEQWRESIEKNLRAAGDVVIVVSTNSMGSEWVKHEGSLAYGWGKRLFPVMIEQVQSLPPWLEEYQWIDFTRQTYLAALQALVATLTPPNPIQDLLNQQVQAYQQTGELIGEAILRVIEENREKVMVDEQAQEVIDKSRQAINERQQHERQLVEEMEAARQRELEKAKQLATSQRQRALVLMVGLVVALALSMLSFILYRQSNQNLIAAQVANTQSAANAATAQVANTLAIEQRDEAQRQESIAHSRELASNAAAQINDHLDLSLLLAAEALRFSETSQAKSAMLNTFHASPYLDQFLFGNFGMVDLPFYTWGDINASIAYSPDGRVLASGGCSEYFDNGDINNNFHCQKGEIVLWDTQTRQPFSRIPAHDGLVSALAFSPDGNTLASGCTTGFYTQCIGEIILWDVSDPARPVRRGEPLYNTINTFRTATSALAFSPDGKLLAVSGPEVDFVELWDLSARQLTLVTAEEGILSEVKSIAFRPDGSTLAMGRCAEFDPERGNCIIGDVSFWDVQLGQLTDLHIRGHADSVYSLAFSPDGMTLATGSCVFREFEECAKGEILLWDAQSGESIPTSSALEEHSSVVTNLFFSDNGRELISGSKDNFIIVWDIEPKILLGTIPGDRVRQSPRSSRLGGAFGQDRREGQAQTGNAQGTIMGTVLSKTSSGYPLAFDGVALSPDGAHLALGHRDGTVILWNLDYGSAGLRHQVGEGAGPISHDTAAFDASGKYFAALNGRNEITFWDLNTLKPTSTPLTEGSTLITSIALSPDGKTIAYGTDTGQIMLRDIASQELIVQLQGDAGWVNNLAFSPDGKNLASTHMSENAILLWNSDSGELAQRLAGEEDAWVEDIAFSPDGQILAASHNNSKKVSLWEVRTGTILGELTGSNFIIMLAFSPDGKILATGDFNNVLLWDVEKRVQVGEALKGHTWFISGLAFSPDGATLASASQRYEVILWDIGTHSKIGSIFSRNFDWVHSLAFSPDGQYMSLDYAYSPLAFWEAKPQAWITEACQMTGRNFSRVEWQQYFPSENYRVTCPQWPAGE